MAKNYKNIHRDFTEELVKQWQEQGFTFEQTADWVNIYSPSEQSWAIHQPYYHVWLRDIKQVDSEWVLNYGDAEALKQEYQQYQLKTLKDLNTPSQPRAFTKKTLLITVLIAGIALYLLIK